MNHKHVAGLLLAAALCAIFYTPPAATAGDAGPREIGSPGFPPTSVLPDGSLQEDWGALRLALRVASGDALTDGSVVETSQSTEPFSEAVTIKQAGAVTLAERAYRAPIWPAGVDVLEAALSNAGENAIEAELVVQVSADVAWATHVGAVGMRHVVALPTDLAPEREANPWGVASSASALPGWAAPSQPCDPAYRNIRVGVQGTPIDYRFAVEPGSAHTVALGLCESHWASAGMRPLELFVEGAHKSVVDPIARWGRHVPGCLRFDARDADSDGVLRVVVASPSGAADANTILNAVWLFPEDMFVDTDEVLQGKLSESAEYYVDCGGERDQTLYRSDEIRYRVTLQPGETRELLFLAAGSGVNALPDPSSTAWTRETLRKAARDVAADN